MNFMREYFESSSKGTNVTSKSFLLLLVVLIVSCGKQDPSIQKTKLAGYWSIESVTSSDGNKKDFSINAIIDYIALSEEKGVRTKVAPKFDGSFNNNGTSESFRLTIEDDSLRLYYTTPFDNWKETVFLVTDSVLKIKNRDSKIYTYKRFRKFTFGN